MPTEYGKTIARNLRRILYERDTSAAEMSRALNINKSTISGWMNGARVPRGQYIDMICQYLGVNRSELVEEHTDGEHNAVVKIPVLGRVAAGIPFEMIDDIRGEEEIPMDMLKGGKEYFALEIDGNSMEPRIRRGDVIIVRKQETAEDGDVVVVAINGADATCKRLKTHPTGISLVSTNPDYDPMYYSNEEIAKLPVTVLGKVVELRAKF